MQNFRALGAPPPDLQNSPKQFGEQFWLRAWQYVCLRLLIEGLIMPLRLWILPIPYYKFS